MAQTKVKAKKNQMVMQTVPWIPKTDVQFHGMMAAIVADMVEALVDLHQVRGLLRHENERHGAKKHLKQRQEGLSRVLRCAKIWCRNS
jgi:hypothetical protein